MDERAGVIFFHETYINNFQNVGDIITIPYILNKDQYDSQTSLTYILWADNFLRRLVAVPNRVGVGAVWFNFSDNPFDLFIDLGNVSKFVFSDDFFAIVEKAFG